MSRFHIRFFLCLVCVLALACSEVPVSRAEGKKVTVMVYMCGSNLESRNNQGTQALGQMIRSRFAADQVNVVVLAGGSGSWNNGFDPGKLTLGELGNGRKITKTEYPLSAMGDGETLSFFLNECALKFPAEENILVFWDHGGGPAYGVCQDELFEGDTLSLNEIASALQSSPYADHGLDLVVFNACLMGSAELSVVLAPYARYLIATEDSMYGLSYDWLAGVENRSVEETARLIVDESFAFNQETIERQNATEINSFSVVDLSKSGKLSTAIDAFFTPVAQKLDSGSFSAFSNQRRDTVSFGAGDSGNASGFDLVDLGDLVTHYRDYAPAEADALLSVLGETVVYHCGALPDCTGLTVYHPYNNKQEDQLRYRIAVFNDLGFAPAYTAYIQSFAALLTGTRMSDWAGLRVIASAKKDQRTLYTMALTEDQETHFGMASLTALLKNKDGSYRFMWAGSHYTLENGILTAEFVNNALCAVDGEGNPVFWPMPYTQDTRGNILIPAELTRHEKETEDGMLPEIIQQGLISCAYDPDSRKLLPGGVLVWDEGMGGFTPAFNTVFTDYDEIRIAVISRSETRDEDGVLLPFDQWTAVSEEDFSAFIDGSWSFAMVPNLAESADLAIAFSVTDTQNNSFFSDLLPAGIAPQDTAVVTEYDDLNLVLINSLKLYTSNGHLNLSIDLSNLTGTEAVITLGNLKLNGIPVEYTADAYGNGENWGLMPGESSVLLCMLPDDVWNGIGTLTEITFDLISSNASDPNETLGAVPVRITTEMDLSGLR